MDKKDVLFYTLVIPTIMWALYEGSFVPGYVNALRENHSECYKSNPNMVSLFFGTMVGLACISVPIQFTAKSFFQHALCVNKFPPNTAGRVIKAEMLAERSLRLFIYIAASLMGLWILKQSNFLSKYLMGTESDPQYFANYPC